MFLFLLLCYGAYMIVMVRIATRKLDAYPRTGPMSDFHAHQAECNRWFYPRLIGGGVVFFVLMVVFA